MKKPTWSFLLLAMLLSALLVSACASGGKSTSSSHKPAVDDDDDNDAADDDDNDDNDSADDDDNDDDDSTDDDDDADSWSLQFDGLTGHLESEAPIVPALSTAFTVEGWFLFDVKDYTTAAVLMDEEVDLAGFYILFGEGWGLRFHYNCADGRDADISVPYAQVTQGYWHHIAVTYGDAGHYCIYLNGNQKVCDNIGSYFFNSPASENLTFGKAHETNLAYFQGRMDMMRISSVVRYTAHFTPPLFYTNDADTVALWRVDEGLGAIVADYSGNANALSVYTGATWVE